MASAAFGTHEQDIVDFNAAVAAVHEHNQSNTAGKSMGAIFGALFERTAEKAVLLHQGATEEEAEVLLNSDDRENVDEIQRRSMERDILLLEHVDTLSRAGLALTSAGQEVRTITAQGVARLGELHLVIADGFAFSTFVEAFRSSTHLTPEETADAQRNVDLAILGTLIELSRAVADGEAEASTFEALTYAGSLATTLAPLSPNDHNPAYLPHLQRLAHWVSLGLANEYVQAYNIQLFESVHDRYPARWQRDTTVTRLMLNWRKVLDLVETIGSNKDGEELFQTVLDRTVASLEFARRDIAWLRSDGNYPADYGVEGNIRIEDVLNAAAKQLSTITVADHGWSIS